MKTAGLFSGIGGFELAFEREGFETGMLVEIDEAARRVLAARFPRADLRSDVTKLGALPAGTELVLAGFPCQNLSMAGDKTGITGAKSSVVEHLFRLLTDSSVHTLVVENVYFMLQLDRGRAMSWLVGELENRGFRWAYRVLDTLGFGLPQRRRRVYLVASKVLDPCAVLFPDGPPTPQENGTTLSIDAPIGFYWTEGRSGVGFTQNGVPPLKVGSSLGICSAPAVLFPDGEVLMPDIGSAELLQGFPADWTDVEFEATSRAPRWRLVGNAVSVPVAAWVAKRLREVRLGAAGSPVDLPLALDRTWPNAAWNLGKGRFGTTATEHPLGRPTASVSDYRDGSWSRLSERAIDGFVKRAEEGGLRMPNGFLDRLRVAERSPPRSRSVRRPPAKRGTGSTEAAVPEVSEGPSEPPADVALPRFVRRRARQIQPIRGA